MAVRAGMAVANIFLSSSRLETPPLMMMLMLMESWSGRAGRRVLTRTSALDTRSSQSTSFFWSPSPPGFCGQDTGGDSVISIMPLPNVVRLDSSGIGSSVRQSGSNEKKEVDGYSLFGLLNCYKVLVKLWKKKIRGIGPARVYYYWPRCWHPLRLADILLWP